MLFRSEGNGTCATRHGPGHATCSFSSQGRGRGGQNGRFRHRVFPAPIVPFTAPRRRQHASRHGATAQAFPVFVPVNQLSPGAQDSSSCFCFNSRPLCLSSSALPSLCCQHSSLPWSQHSHCLCCVACRPLHSFIRAFPTTSSSHPPALPPPPKRHARPSRASHLLLITASLEPSLYASVLRAPLGLFSSLVPQRGPVRRRALHFSLAR